MKVEIWSDVMCPFCYIGKRKFETALESFPHKDSVEIVWKSFQLDPSMEHIPGKNVQEYLAERKGISLQRAQEMHAHVTAMAKDVGLTYDFDRAVVANSFDAHRLSHLAAKHGLQDTAEERLFRAYFTEGKDTGDAAVLAELGTEIGIDADEVRKTLASDTYAQDVKNDVKEASALGIRGVPFFLIDRKFSVSGAQPSAIFSEVLQKAWKENSGS